MSSSFKSTNKGRSNFENGRDFIIIFIESCTSCSSSRLKNKRRKLRFKDQISRSVMFRKTQEREEI